MGIRERLSVPPAYLDKIYIRKICYLSFFPNKEK